jgi:hypothetical protein
MFSPDFFLLKLVMFCMSSQNYLMLVRQNYQKSQVSMGHVFCIMDSDPLSAVIGSEGPGQSLGNQEGI